MISRIKRSSQTEIRGALALVLEKSLTMAGQFLAGEHRPLACSSRQLAANRFHFVGSGSSCIKAFALLRKLHSAGCRMLQAGGLCSPERALSGTSI
jgi:hypothetical protein